MKQGKPKKLAIMKKKMRKKRMRLRKTRKEMAKETVIRMKNQVLKNR